MLGIFRKLHTGNASALLSCNLAFKIVIYSCLVGLIYTGMAEKSAYLTRQATNSPGRPKRALVSEEFTQSLASGSTICCCLCMADSPGVGIRSFRVALILTLNPH